MKTAEEFNEKYKEFILPGFGGLSFSNIEVIEYLDGIFSKIKNKPGFLFYQMKMKFGKSCFYCKGLEDSLVLEIENQIDNIINR